MLIDTTNLPIFLSAVAALLIVPGPDFFLITSQATSRGMKYGLACAFGIGLAGILQTAIVALGFGKVMETWPFIATVIRLAGAAYLAILGIGLLKSWWRRRDADDLPEISSHLERSVKSIFFVGLANNLLNPKALLFFSVFIPQFVNPSLGSSSIQIAILGSLLTTIALFYNLAIAFMFAQFQRLEYGKGLVARNGEGLVGALFLILAGRLAASKVA